MEISKQTPLLTAKDHEKLPSASDSVELEENGNIALNSDEKTPVTTDGSNCRPVDQFFTHQARGDLSPIKPGAGEDDVAAESLDLKLDDSCPRKSQSACVQPESFVCEPTNMFEVNILETTLDSKLDADQSQADLLNESAASRKRPQTEMEPAVFEVPRMTKHPHTDAPPVPEFRDDSEPLIQFSSDNETIFRVALSGENANDAAEPVSFQENPEVSSCAEKQGSATFDKGSATFDKGPAATEKELAEENDPPRAGVEPSAYTKAPDATTAAGSVPKTIKSEESSSLSIIQSIDEFLDPLVRCVFPIMRRGTGLNTAFVCIPLVVASIFYFYFRL